jgi:hypothetical protein
MQPAGKNFPDSTGAGRLTANSEAGSDQTRRLQDAMADHAEFIVGRAYPPCFKLRPRGGFTRGGSLCDGRVTYALPLNDDHPSMRPRRGVFRPFVSAGREFHCYFLLPMAPGSPTSHVGFGVETNMREQHETAFENDRRACHGAVRDGVCRNGNACERGGLLLHQHFRNAGLWLFDHGAVSGWGCRRPR